MARYKYTPYPLDAQTIRKQMDSGIEPGTKCSYLMPIKKHGTPCPRFGVRTLDGKIYCDQHGPGKFKPKMAPRPSSGAKSKVVKPSRGKPYQPDPYYQTPEWRMLRFDTLRRDKNTCRYCGGYAHQADHVIPRKKGGPDALSNLVACCSSCNRVAGNREFRSIELKKKWILIHRDL